MDLSLHFAVIHKDLEAVKHYLARGYNANQPGIHGCDSLLQTALFRGNLEICKALLNSGALCTDLERSIIEHSFENLKLAISDSSYELERALVLVISTDQCDLLRFMLKHFKFNINMGSGVLTLLHVAIRFNNFPITELLLENGADPEIKNFNSDNALKMAFKNCVKQDFSQTAQRIYTLLLAHRYYDCSLFVDPQKNG